MGAGLAVPVVLVVISSDGCCNPYQMEADLAVSVEQDVISSGRGAIIPVKENWFDLQVLQPNIEWDLGNIATFPHNSNSLISPVLRRWHVKAKEWEENKIYKGNRAREMLAYLSSPIGW